MGWGVPILRLDDDRPADAGARGRWAGASIAPTVSSDALEPVALMVGAIEAAADDAGLSGPPEADSIRVVSTLSWRYQNPAYVIAQRIGLEPRELAVTTMGGNSPQALVNTTARQILAGELDVAILVGGEAWRTRMRARREGVELDWPRAPDDQPPTTIGSEFTMNLPGRARPRDRPAGAGVSDVRHRDPGGEWQEPGRSPRAHQRDVVAVQRRRGRQPQRVVAARRCRRSTSAHPRRRTGWSGSPTRSA